MSSPAPHDTVVNVVHHQIKRGIRVCLDHECFGSAVILVYSGIDAMAYVSLPAERERVKRAEIVRWANRYMPLCKSGDLTGDELYSARCAMLHTYGVASDMTRQGRCRQIGYADDMRPPVRFDPAISKNLVIVSIKALAEGFLSAVDQFLIDVFSNQELAPVAERRFENICVVHKV